MSLGVVRLGDQCSGHGGFPSRPNQTAAINVYANGIPVHRLGDYWPTHCDGHSCHDGYLLTASTTVFANGVGVARVGDEVSCGSHCQVGSANVFAGG